MQWRAATAVALLPYGLHEAHAAVAGAQGQQDAAAIGVCHSPTHRARLSIPSAGTAHAGVCAAVSPSRPQTLPFRARALAVAS